MTYPANVVLRRGDLAANISAAKAGASGVGSAILAAPASGATITFWASNANLPAGSDVETAPQWARFQWEIDSSHDSAASGVIIECTQDGTTWNAIPGAPLTYTTASGMAAYDVLSYGRHMRFRYTNSANTLTRWLATLKGTRVGRSSGY